MLTASKKALTKFAFAAAAIFKYIIAKYISYHISELVSIELIFKNCHDYYSDNNNNELNQLLRGKYGF